MVFFITFATSHDRCSYIKKDNFNDFSLRHCVLATKQKYTLQYINYVSLYFFFFFAFFFCLIEKQQIARKIIQS